MFYISHRGNLIGKNKKTENKPDQIERVLKQNFHCEIDVWYIRNNFFLGHDSPQYLVQPIFLKQKKLWCHAKNIEALYELLKLKAHCFFHNIDAVTLTSKGYIWTYPGEPLTKRSIAVCPEVKSSYNIEIAKGICSDYISYIKNDNFNFI